MNSYSITYDSVEGPFIITLRAKNAKNALNRVVFGKRLCDWNDIIRVEIFPHD